MIKSQGVQTVNQSGSVLRVAGVLFCSKANTHIRKVLPLLVRPCIAVYAALRFIQYIALAQILTEASLHAMVIAVNKIQVMQCPYVLLRSRG